MNVLLLTADDLNCSTVGVFGGVPGDVTPNIDRLAAQGLKLGRGHVSAAVCQPSRQMLMTGRLCHNYGSMGFSPIRRDVPTLQESLRAAGYLNGILGKVKHLAPEAKFCWDMVVDQPNLKQGRDPDSYRRRAAEFFEQAKTAGRPFFLMANSHDPHRPFHGSDQERNTWGDAADRLPKPSKVYQPDEVTVPGFLPDLPEVRREIAEYCSSARRCDDTVGAVLAALDASGLADNTLVMFLSDNGMALPFAKTNCYLHSTHTPWLVRWPGRIEPGQVDDTHYVAGVDYTPTILDLLGLPLLDQLDGRSFAPLLRDGRQDGREQICTLFDQTSGKKDYPMRAHQTADHGYIYNAWSDGQTVFKNESQAGRTFKAMSAAAGSDPAIKARVDLFLKRVPEEYYDFSTDPDALHNLIDEPAWQPKIREARQALLTWMRGSNDYVLPMFEKHLAKVG